MSNIGEKINFISDLCEFLEKNNLKRSQVCIIGSSVLTEKGLKENNDLDIAISPEARKNIDMGDLNINSNNLEIGLEKYQWIGITDSELVSNHKYHYVSEGFKFAKPEVVYSYKQRRRKSKDLEQIELIEKNLIDSVTYDWNWELFSYEYYPSWRNRRNLPATKNQKLSNIARLDRSLRQNGLVETARIIIDRKVPLNIFDQDDEKIDDDLRVQFVLWPTAIEYSDNIRARIEDSMDVINEERIELGEDVREFVDEVYSHNEDSKLLEFKKYKIEKEGDFVKNITAILSESTQDQAESSLSEIKDKVREEIYPYVSESEYHLIMHGPDELSEVEWMNEVIGKYKASNK